MGAVVGVAAVAAIASYQHAYALVRAQFCPAHTAPAHTSSRGATDGAAGSESAGSRFDSSRGHENGSTNRTECSCRASHRCGSRPAKPVRAGCDSPGATSTVSSTGAHAMDGRYGTIALAEGEEFAVWEKGSHACCRRVVRSLASTPPGEIVQNVCPMTSERSIGDPS